MALGVSLSEAASLALHGMALIANANQDEMINVKTMADASQSSEAHLAKVMQRLVRAGILDSVRGPRGGFRLAKPPEKITLLAICEVIEGKLDFEGCPAGKSKCPLNRCLFTGFIAETGAAFREYLAKVTIADVRAVGLNDDMLSFMTNKK